MGWHWRALVAALIIGGTALWAPVAATNAAASFLGTGTTAQAPYSQDNDDNQEDDDNDDADNADNAEDNDNDVVADNGNANDNGEDNDNDGAGGTSQNVPTDPSGTGAPVTSSNLTVELWKSNERPVVNQPFQIGVTGNGAQIAQVWWWAESPNPTGDDMGALGVQMSECGGVQPCAHNWTIVGRNVGYYRIYARVRDISGREVQTEWYVLVSENTRSG